MHSPVIAGLFYFLLIKAWKSLTVQCEAYITVKQYPAIASIKYGTSALLDCIFDFQFLSEAEIEVNWNIQLPLFNDSVKKITMSSKMLPLNQSASLSRDDGKYKLTGNLLKGVVFLEVKNLQPRDVGLYTCKVARLIPPPYLEGSSNGTYICGIEDTLQDSCKPSETKFVICLGTLAACTFVIIMTTIIYVQVRRKSTCTSSPSLPSRDSMVYVDMNFAKQSTNSEE
ncbi:uncharacterized protein LOC125630159 [Caretta caretta]|uniref:uncharacterized protein LOC125630159 n=1 Tax=Caretta caretta TaxID=8467 RepID=UPI0020960DBF|nr:sodium channel subunit beta-2-like [Caretta caretta]